jgi:hypothetical protein
MKIYTGVGFYKLNATAIDPNAIQLLQDTGSSLNTGLIDKALTGFISSYNLQPIDNSQLNDIIKNLVINREHSGSVTKLPDGLPLDYAIPEKGVTQHRYALGRTEDGGYCVIVSRKAPGTPGYNKDVEWSVVPAIEDFMIEKFAYTKEDVERQDNIIGLLNRGSIFTKLPVRSTFSQYLTSGKNPTIEVVREEVGASIVIRTKSDNMEKARLEKNVYNVVSYLYENRKGKYEPFFLKYTVSVDTLVGGNEKLKLLVMTVVKRIDGTAKPDADPYPVSSSRVKEVVSMYSNCYRDIKKYIHCIEDIEETKFTNIYFYGGETRQVKYFFKDFQEKMRPALERSLAVLRTILNENTLKNMEFREQKLRENAVWLMKDLAKSLRTKPIRPCDASTLIEVNDLDEVFGLLPNKLISQLKTLLASHDLSSLEAFLKSKVTDTGRPVEKVDFDSLKKTLATFDCLWDTLLIESYLKGGSGYAQYKMNIG